MGVILVTRWVEVFSNSALITAAIGVCVAMEQKSAISNPAFTFCILRINAVVPMNASGLG